jgi:IMP dehydrogenase/GMP reductase
MNREITLLGLSLEDISLLPADFSFIKSRKDVITHEEVANTMLPLPVISSNMTSVYSPKLSQEVAKHGGISIVHRFCSIEENVNLFEAGIFIDEYNHGRNFAQYIPWVSVGSSPDELVRAEALVSKGAEVLVLDLAMGNSINAVEQYKRLVNRFPNVDIVVSDFCHKAQLDAFVYHAGGTPSAFTIGQGVGCFVVGTRVLMNNGTYKNIEDVKIHDWVINKDGKPVEVIGTQFSGFKKVKNYKTNNFYKISSATEDHLHWVSDYKNHPWVGNNGAYKFLDKHSTVKWNRLDNLLNTKLLLPKSINFDLPESFVFNLSEFALSRRQYKSGLMQFDNIIPSYELGYLFGTFLGDGNSHIYHTNNRKNTGRRNTSSNISWYFGKHEIDIANKVINYLKSVFNVNCKMEIKSNIILLSCRCNPLARLFFEFGKKQKKHLPNKYICSNKEYLNGLYDGLIDSDGHVEKDGREGFTNTSPELIELFMFLHYMKKGYYPSVRNIKPTIGGLKNINIENCKESYQLRSVMNPDWVNTKDYQIINFKMLSDNELLLPTYDIEVDDLTQSFIANNAIVHNSACRTRRTTGIGFPSASAIMDCSKGDKYNLILNGGVRDTDDFCKALALGCKAVIVGRLFAGCLESGAKKIIPPVDITEKVYKDELGEWQAMPNSAIYRGSAASSSYEEQGKEADFRAAEGEEYIIPVTGTVKDLMNKLNGGLRSSMSYLNAKTLTEFRKSVKIVQLTNNGSREQSAYGKYEA